MEEQLRTVLPSKGVEGRGTVEQIPSGKRYYGGDGRVRKTHVVQTRTRPGTQNLTQDRQGETRAVLRRQWKTIQ